MAVASTYTTGTASVAAGNTAVTGTGTTWLTSGIQAGDLFWANGMSCRIADVISNTSITLAYPWPGSSLVGGTYEIRFTPDATRVLASARKVIDMLDNGTVAALALAGSLANKFAYYTGAGVAALADITGHARAFLALSGGAGKFPRSTGANTIVMQDMVGTVAQVGGVPTGAIVERGSNANGEYVRFADGTQICTGTFTGYTANVEKNFTFPAPFSGSTQRAVTASVIPYESADYNYIYYNITTTYGSFVSSSTKALNVVCWSAIGRWF